VKILITRLEGKCKYFSSIKFDSYRKLTLSRKVSTNHRFSKPQGNTALDFVIVLDKPEKRQDLIFFFLNVDFSKIQEMKVYGWRNGAKFTKFIFIHIQRFDYHSRIYLSTFNS